MDFDLYDDVLFGGQHSEKDNELKLENETLRAKNEELTNKLRTLSKLNETLSEDLNKVKLNLSSLLKTSRCEINRRADAMSKLKTEMDKLVLQQAIRTGTRAEYEKVFESYKESLKEFEPRKYVIPGRDRESILDEIQVTTEGNKSTVIYGNSSITIFKDTGFLSTKKPKLKRRLDLEKENSCATETKRMKLEDSETLKSKAFVPDAVKERKRTSELSYIGKNEKHVKKSVDSGTRLASLDGNEKRQDGSTHRRGRTNVEDRRDKWPSRSRRRSPSHNETYKSSRNKTPTKRLPSQESSKTRNVEKDSRRSSRARTSGERLSERESRQAARSYHRDKDSRRVSESQISNKRAGSRGREDYPKERTSDKTKDIHRKENATVSPNRLEQGKITEVTRRNNFDSNSENKFPLSNKSSKQGPSVNGGASNPVKMNAPKNITDSSRLKEANQELEDGEIILNVQPDDILEIENEITKPAKPLRPSQKLNCELFSESDEESPPNIEINKRISQSKDAKRLPVDLSVIDSVDLTSMIEEKKRQMNQLEKMKAKCLEKMSQPSEKPDLSSDTKSLKIRISLPKETSSDSSPVEAPKSTITENRTCKSKPSEVSVAGSSLKTDNLSQISDLSSPEGIASILKSDQLQQSLTSLVHQAPNSRTNQRSSPFEVTAPRRSPRKAVEKGGPLKTSTKSPHGQNSSNSKRLQSNQKVRPSPTTSGEPIKPTPTETVADKDSSITPGLLKRQPYVRSLKFSPEVQTSSSTVNLRPGKEGTVLRNNEKTKEKFKDLSKSIKSPAKKSPKFTLHTSVLASIKSPIEPPSVEDVSVVTSKTPCKSEKSATSQDCSKFSTSKRSLVTSLGLDLSSDDDDEDDRCKGKPQAIEVKRSPRKKVQLKMCSNSNQLQVVFES